jgi:hypothetical protein
MNRFIIVDGLPYLYANDRAYAVRWDDKGFTVGNEVKLTFVPYPLYSELEIKAKCTVFDSIGASDHQEEEQPKKATRGRKKATE